MTNNENVSKAVAEIVEGEITGKKWYLSKTFWANVIAGAAVVIQMKYGFPIPVEYQMLLLSLVNVGLRKITKTPVVW
jgi:hypothetical protein